MRRGAQFRVVPRRRATHLMNYASFACLLLTGPQLWLYLRMYVSVSAALFDGRTERSVLYQRLLIAWPSVTRFTHSSQSRQRGQQLSAVTNTPIGSRLPSLWWTFSGAHESSAKLVCRFDPKCAVHQVGELRGLACAAIAHRSDSCFFLITIRKSRRRVVRFICRECASEG